MTVPKSISGDSTLLSTSQVADELGVHRSTVHGWVKSGMLPSTRHGAFHGIKRKDLKRFLTIYNIQPQPKKKKRGSK